MSCPYSDEELDLWDSVTNPMGDACNTCQNFDCEHNSNLEENPEYYPDWQEIAFSQNGNSSTKGGDP